MYVAKLTQTTFDTLFFYLTPHSKVSRTPSVMSSWTVALFQAEYICQSSSSVACSSACSCLCANSSRRFEHELNVTKRMTSSTGFSNSRKIRLTAPVFLFIGNCSTKSTDITIYSIHIYVKRSLINTVKRMFHCDNTHTPYQYRTKNQSEIIIIMY